MVFVCRLDTLNVNFDALALTHVTIPSSNVGSNACNTAFLCVVCAWRMTNFRWDFIEL